MIEQEKITHLSGKLYYKVFLAGANKILENQSLLNSINVFPVPDADTGTNLASTIRSVIDTAQPTDSFQQTANAIALAALNGARGNSGVIFAQFLYGVSLETGESRELSIHDFAEGLKRSVQHIYNAVSEPIEGTMISVIRDWADFIYAQKDSFEDFIHLFLQAFEIAKKSLAETTAMIRSLSLANVVDAGAKGFVLFLEGVMEGLRKKSNPRDIIVHEIKSAQINIESINHDNFQYRYCTETMLKGKNLQRNDIKDLISDLGDSLVIAGSEQMARIHIHTDQPHIFFERLRSLGVLSYQKAEDMRMQQMISKERKYKIALVTDSTSDLPPELIEKYQIHVVPLNLHFGENQYLDKLTIKPEQFFKLIKSSKHFPTTSHPNEAQFTALYSNLIQHYDSVISVHLTQKFSATFHSASTAAKKISSETGKKISVLDSGHVSGSLGLLTLRIADAIEKGADHEQITDNFGKWIQNSRIYVSVKDLKYMVRGGRVSAAKGFMAKALNVKPIVSMDQEGNSLLFDKAFSQKKNMKKVLKHTRNFLDGKKLWNYQILHAEGDETANWFKAEMKKLTGKEALSLLNISPVIGLSAGEGAVAIALIAE